MNRLAGETSPYLRQHADNPVDWYTWGDAAFAAARERDVPILLSIGYSACHWCHVMAHESFEDPATASVMNERFVNVKVDREERPDVDAIYMQAVQAMTGGGGWPLTVFLAPDGKPFFGGTYFPDEPRHGMPSFVQLLDSVTEAWRDHRGELDQQAEKLVDAIAVSTKLQPSREILTDDALRGAYAYARDAFDLHLGGFGRAPKFPHAMLIDALLRMHARNRAPETLTMITTSLDAMAAGGIYDHVGGGFARYSTDAAWLVPHFEKMLYDQALLVRAYAHAFLATGDACYQRVVEKTVGYVLRDLRHPDGGFYSAEDADSEGVEGKFYVWSLAEIRSVCGADAGAVIDYFGVTEEGNFEGANILNVPSRDLRRPPEVEQTLPRLYAAREQRVRPGLDDKVLLAWNAFFLDALAEAAAIFDREDWMEAARANVRFLLSSLKKEDGRLLRSWQSDAHEDRRVLAYAEDYAALIEALVTMAEVDDVSWLAVARRVADRLLELFYDDPAAGGAGGFFTTGADAEQLVVRAKDLFDNATPAENSLAAHALLRLATLTGEHRYEEAAVATLRLAGDAMTRQPSAFPYLLGALERYLTPPIEIAVIGDANDPATLGLRREVWRRLLPASVRVAAPPASGGTFTPLLADRALLADRPTAFVCERFACKLPVNTPADLAAQIDDALRTR